MSMATATIRRQPCGPSAVKKSRTDWRGRQLAQALAKGSTVNLAHRAPVQTEEFGHVGCGQLGAQAGNGLGQALCDALVATQPLDVLHTRSTLWTGHATHEHLQLDFAA